MNKTHVERYCTDNTLFFYDRPKRPIKAFYFQLCILLILGFAFFFTIFACFEIAYYINHGQWNSDIDGKETFLFFSICSGILLLVAMPMYAGLMFVRYKVVTVRINKETIGIDTYFGLFHWRQDFLTNEVQIALESDRRAEIRPNIIHIKDKKRCYKWNIPQIDEAKWIASEIRMLDIPVHEDLSGNANFNWMFR